MMFPVVRALALMALLIPAVVQAGPLKLVFGAGVVTIDAQDVPLGAILDEWAKLGGTRIDGMDKLSEVTVTFHVEGIPEDEALAALLNKRNGYSTVPRKSGEPGASQFARIAVFSPTSQPIARPSVVPKDWPVEVNEHPDGADQPPTEVSNVRPGVDIPWPVEIAEPEASPIAVPAVDGLPGVDVPWPLPLTLPPDFEPPPIDPTVPSRPGIDMPWPVLINLKPDGDVQPSSDSPANADAAAATAAEDKAAADKAATAKTKGAPVSTKAPKPIPPPKRPPVRPKR